MTKAIKILLSTISIFLITGFAINNNEIFNGPDLVMDPDMEFGAEYFSTDKDLVLYYESNFGEAKSLVKNDGEKLILDMRSDDFIFIQDVVVRNDSVYLTRLEEEVDVLFFFSADQMVTYNEPALRIPFPMKAGQTWKWEGIEYIDEDKADSIVISGELLGMEIVSTAAGEFECIKIQTDIHKKSGVHTRFYEWRTPKIGLVKLEAQMDTKGFIGTIIDLLGYDSMYFSLIRVGA